MWGVSFEVGQVNGLEVIPLMQEKGGVTYVELCGAWIGLSMAWDLGFKKAWLELGLVEPLELIKHGCLPNHPNAPLVETHKELLGK